ncbi:single-stranded DNA-binding protein, partial [Vibrio alginolyticus]|nr:single-stranded DNA-binding protein [Vibrio alginolyticus]EGR1299339.1 single-stranded DNA-binding protein [Vibrio alginolyticus]
TAQEYDTLMSYTQLTPGEISEAFGLGFTLVFVGGYLSTYAIKMAIRLIKLL